MTTIKRNRIGHLTLKRDGENHSQYNVTERELSREHISTLLGKLVQEPFIFLDYDLQSDEEKKVCSLYTTNKDAIAVKQRENPEQMITRVQIKDFILERAWHEFYYSEGKWNNYDLLIVISNDWEDVEITFYENAVTTYSSPQ
jgi:hypothetical protein